VSSAEALSLLPLLVLAGGSVVLMLLIAFSRSHGAAAGLCLLVLAASLASIPAALGAAPRRVTALLVVDRFALFYVGLLAAAAFAVCVLSYGYLERRDEERKEEYYLLLLLATLGAAVLPASAHFASLFAGLEILSVSLYALVAFPRAAAKPLEAGVKYLVLAGASSAFLLMGMALVYAALGTMDLSRMPALSAGAGAPVEWLLPGLGLFVAGLGFKLAVVPFHMWTPDVYEGAPAPVTAFVATVSKGAVVALLVRYFVRLGVHGHSSLWLVVALIAGASMLVGNFLALLQDNVKRILAYSSIGQLGYVLVAFLAGGRLGVEAVSFYLVAYFVTTLSAFGVVAALSGPDRDADDLGDYRGLFWRRPWLSGAMTAALLSLAGMPLTGGFMGKLLVVKAGAATGMWALVFILVAGSVVGLFYYLRVIAVMYATPAGAGSPPAVVSPAPSLFLAGGVVLAVLALLLVWLGVYPDPVVRAVRTAAEALVQ
jgi:NADH-quinone oxidoreductase subunit N